ncbi:hypothetical protein [Altererythrobacter sp. MTPC7]|uniref:hypothetical protein n=1 Tax=Altererythrobacter sp. MTPC7 TaxID=3056567 RepID=UPI0036F29DB5
MWAAMVSEPAMVLIVKPGSGVWRLSRAQFKRTLGSWRRFGKARDMGALFDADHLEFDPDERRETIRRDVLGRPYLSVGPSFVTLYVLAKGGSDDLYRDMDDLFVYRDDADRAARAVAREAIRCGATLEEVPA